MVLLSVTNLKKYFPVEKTMIQKILSRKQEYVKAVDGVSFDIREGEVLALIGESGSGKTTTGRLVLRLLKPTDGKIVFMGKDITFLDEKDLRPYRKYMQIIFQDPYASLNPRMKIGEALMEPLLVNELATPSEARDKAIEMLEKVGLIPAKEFFERHPQQLSGGQRQRVAVARAMMTNPKFVVADEAVSMIDMSMRAVIIELLDKFRRETGLSILFITHDIAVGKLIADRIAVMYLGKLVEIGPTKEVITRPRHPYTLALLEAVPSIKKRGRKRILKIKGEIPDARNPPPGCRFNPRCPLAKGDCEKQEPSLRKVGTQHYVACHHPLDKELDI